MNTCTIQRGIFSLRTCDGLATEMCSTCQQPLCTEHAHYGREAILCPKCLAVSSDNDSEVDVDDSDWDSPGWSQRWSSNYNSSHAAAPLGLHASQRFDDHDRNAFSSRSDGVMADDGDGDGDGPAGFSDS